MYILNLEGLQQTLQQCARNRRLIPRQGSMYFHGKMQQLLQLSPQKAALPQASSSPEFDRTSWLPVGVVEDSCCFHYLRNCASYCIFWPVINTSTPITAFSFCNLFCLPRDISFHCYLLFILENNY